MCLKCPLLVSMAVLVAEIGVAADRQKDSVLCFMLSPGDVDIRPPLIGVNDDQIDGLWASMKVMSWTSMASRGMSTVGASS